MGIAWAGLQWASIWSTPFHTHGEPREAIVVQDVLRSGNWILPRGNGRELPFKPPLFYWLSAITAKVRGKLDEATVRLPSALLSGVACLLLAAVATTVYGAVAGLVSGFTLLTSFEWQRAAVSARVDMTLAFGLTLVFIALLRLREGAHRGWLLLFYLGCAWATLSKGIPGLAIPAFQVLLVCLLLDRSASFAYRLRPLVGGTGVIAIAGAWYAAAAARGGRPFVALVMRENLTRAVGAAHFTLGHRHSIGYLVAALLAGLLPWTILLPSVVAALWKERRRLNRSDPRLFALLWLVAVFTPYALAASKRGVYLLALYPAVSLLIGWWAARLVRGDTGAPWLRGLLQPPAWGLAGVLAVIALVAILQDVGVPALATVAGLLDSRTAADVRAVAAGGMGYLALAAALAATAAVVLACASRSRRWDIALAAMAGCTAAVIIAVSHAILPAVAARQSRQGFVRAMRRVVEDSGGLYTTPTLDYGTLFYWKAALPEFDRSSGAPPPRYLLAPAGAWTHMSTGERESYERVPGLRAAPGGNQGDVVLLQRVDVGDSHGIPQPPGS